MIAKCPQCGGDVRRIEVPFSRDENGYVDGGDVWQCYDCIAVSTEKEMEKANAK